MPIFNEDLYRRGRMLSPQPRHQQYRLLLEEALARCTTEAERMALLQFELAQRT
jgi:hypothetical protein